MPSISYSNEIPYGASRKADAELRKNTQAAYAEVMTATDRKRSPVANLQKMAKGFLECFPKNEWGPDMRRLDQVAAVPLTSENVTWFFEQSVREACVAACNETAENDPDRTPDGPPPPDMDRKMVARMRKDYAQKETIRRGFREAIAAGADAADVRRFMEAIKKPGVEDDEDENADPEARDIRRTLRSQGTREEA